MDQSQECECKIPPVDEILGGETVGKYPTALMPLNHKKSALDEQ